MKGKLLTTTSIAIVDITVSTNWSGRQNNYNLPCNALSAARGSEQQDGRSQRHADHSLASNDQELLENYIDMENIDANSVDACTDESIIEYLESRQERDASVTVEFVKSVVLVKVPFTSPGNDPALRVTKTVADYYYFHRNLRLDFINGKRKKTVEHLVLVIKPDTLKALIESKLEMDKLSLMKDFLEFVAFLEKMAILHDEHCHVVDHKKAGDSGTNNMAKIPNVGGRRSGHKPRGILYGGSGNKASDRDRTKSGHGRSWDSTGTGKQSGRENSPCLNTEKCLGEKHYLSCPHTGKDEAIVVLYEYKKMPTRRRQTSKLWATKERWRTTEMGRPRTS
jgi:hypothetical protein